MIPFFQINEIQERIIIFTVVVVSLILHECAHGQVAYWNGDPTAKRMGRVTINPLAHFEPFGLIMLMFLPVGFAKPVPVNPNNFKNYKRGTIAVSLAGITVNLIMMFLFTGVYYAMFAFGGDFIYSSLAGTILFWFMFAFASVNLSLALFNLLPIYPLDGFRVVEVLTPYGNKYVMFMRRYGHYVLMALMLIRVLADYIPFFTYIDLLGFLINFLGYFISMPVTLFWSWVFGIL